MQANSRVPFSAQTGIHEHLAELLDRHAKAPFRKPYADYNRTAFDVSMERRQRLAPNAPLILDSCCGVGESSIVLARSFPDHYVIGVDQSASRLARNITDKADGLPENFDLVRADLVDFWRLMQGAGIRLARHYLLYPNPWPKIGHLSRRWHGHPVFPAMLELGGVLECRSNWQIYLEEFAYAIRCLKGKRTTVTLYNPEAPITPFERKYVLSRHQIYRTIVDL